MLNLFIYEVVIYHLVIKTCLIYFFEVSTFSFTLTGRNYFSFSSSLSYK